MDTLGRSAKVHIAPRARTVQRGHQFLGRIENDIRHMVSTRRSSRISNHWMIRPDGTIQPSIEASVRMSPRIKRPQRGEIVEALRPLARDHKNIRPPHDPVLRHKSASQGWQCRRRSGARRDSRPRSAEKFAALFGIDAARPKMTSNAAGPSQSIPPSGLMSPAVSQLPIGA